MLKHGISWQNRTQRRTENLAGLHGDWLMIWADEASGVPDANFGVMGGALSDKRNRMVLTSQPTRNNGFLRHAP